MQSPTGERPYKLPLKVISDFAPGAIVDCLPPQLLTRPDSQPCLIVADSARDESYISKAHYKYLGTVVAGRAVQIVGNSFNRLITRHQAVQTGTETPDDWGYRWMGELWSKNVERDDTRFPNLFGQRSRPDVINWQDSTDYLNLANLRAGMCKVADIIDECDDPSSLTAEKNQESRAIKRVFGLKFSLGDAAVFLTIDAAVFNDHIYKGRRWSVT